MTPGSKSELLARIGDAVKKERLRQNLPQTVLAVRSGVSLGAVKHLEAGVGATLGTFVSVCRALDKDSWIRSFVRDDVEISPVEYVELLNAAKRKERKRARRPVGR